METGKNFPLLLLIKLTLQEELNTTSQATLRRTFVPTLTLREKRLICLNVRLSESALAAKSSQGLCSMLMLKIKKKLSQPEKNGNYLTLNFYHVLKIGFTILKTFLKMVD